MDFIDFDLLMSLSRRTSAYIDHYHILLQFGSDMQKGSFFNQVSDHGGYFSESTGSTPPWGLCGE